jgi:hypothetical protein
VDISEKLIWGVVTAATSTIATAVAVKAVTSAWELATGEAPPEPNDPQVPLRRALIWALASGVGIGLTQLLVNRFAAARWTAATGKPVPRVGKTTLRI